MTRQEARGIYEIASAICRDDKELWKLCKSKNVPDQLISEFMEEDEDNERLDEEEENH